MLETFPAPTTVFRVGAACLGAPLFDVPAPDLSTLPPGPGLDIDTRLRQMERTHAQLRRQIAALHLRVSLLESIPPWWVRLGRWLATLWRF